MFDRERHEKMKSLWMEALDSVPVLPIKLHTFIEGSVKQAFMDTFGLTNAEAGGELRRMYWTLADEGVVMTSIGGWMIRPREHGDPKDGFYGGGWA